eukprot:scaffold100_cov357-Prasinococcus_capsulatus_cf.AAC.1
MAPSKLRNSYAGGRERGEWARGSARRPRDPRLPPNTRARPARCVARTLRPGPGQTASLRGR